MNSADCKAPHAVFSSHLLLPNILQSSLFSNTLNVCSSLRVGDQVSHPHKIRGGIIVSIIAFMSRGSSGSIVSDYGLDDRAIKVWSPTGVEDFSSTPASRLTLGPTQAPIQWVPGVKHGQGVMLSTHPHLVSRLSTSRSYTSTPPMHLHGM
jgi:hypothetical protein